MDCALYVLHALSPLHAGVGQGDGLVDLPIARERVTGHPIVPSSSVRGVLRDALEPAHRAAVFGSASASGGEHAGALRVSDAHLLLMPVGSDLGTFAWVTCPWLLARLARDAAGLGGIPAHAPRVEQDQVLVADGSVLACDRQATIGDLPLRVGGPAPEDWASALARLVFGDDAWWVEALVQRLAIVDDDTLTGFAQHRTDIRAHVRVDDETGTAERDSLWYEEALPAETVLAGVLHAVPPPKHRDTSAAEILDRVRPLQERVLQLGGRATRGMGRSRFRMIGGAP